MPFNVGAGTNAGTNAAINNARFYMPHIPSFRHWPGPHFASVKSPRYGRVWPASRRRPPRAGWAPHHYVPHRRPPHISPQPIWWAQQWRPVHAPRAYTMRRHR